METSAPRFEDIRWDYDAGIRKFNIAFDNNSARIQIIAGIVRHNTHIYDIYVDRRDLVHLRLFSAVESYLNLDELEARCVYIDLVKRYLGGNFNT